MNQPTMLTTNTPRLRQRGALGAAVATLALLVTAGCSGNGVYETTQIPTPPAPSATAPAPSPTSTAPPPACGNRLASFAPDGPNPAPIAIPAAGGYVAQIQKRGRLIAGVSSDTFLLGSRNPLTGHTDPICRLGMPGPDI